MSLLEYFNKVFDRVTFYDDDYTYVRIRHGVFFTLNASGLFIDISKPKFIVITNRYSPTEKRIYAMKALLDILKWE